MSRPTTNSFEFYVVIKHVYIPFACLDTKGRKVKGYHGFAIRLNLQRTWCFIFLPEVTFDLLHFHCFRSLAAVMFWTERVTRELVFVRKQRIWFALLKLLWRIYYKDQYVDLDGNQRDLDLFPGSEWKNETSVWQKHWVFEKIKNDLLARSCWVNTSAPCRPLIS